jgi:hypothetical protein
MGCLPVPPWAVARARAAPPTVGHPPTHPHPQWVTHLLTNLKLWQWQWQTGFVGLTVVESK